MTVLTADKLVQKLDNLKASTIPSIEKAMVLAAMNVEGEAKKYCTPGQSPYYRRRIPTTTIPVVIPCICGTPFTTRSRRNPIAFTGW